MDSVMEEVTKTPQIDCSLRGAGTATPHSHPDDTSSSDVEKGVQDDAAADWDSDPRNPYNFSTLKKTNLTIMMSMMALTASIGTSIMSPSTMQLQVEFGVSRTVALIPLTLYVLALGFGPVVGGPLSETVGRYPVFMLFTPLGAIFSLVSGFVHNFGALCFLRFLAGFFWGPLLSVAPGTLAETFHQQFRGPVSAVFILMPFLGPGLGPVIGSYVAVRKGWRWVEYTLVFFAVFCILLTPFAQETFHPVLKRRIAKKRGEELPPQPPLADRLRMFAQVALVRPLRMLLTEPIVTFICLYVAVDFGTLFTFFAAVPYTFGTVYHFSLEESGLVFLSIVIGCLLGLMTVLACDFLLYRRQVPNFPPHRIPPEYRLYPAMIGSIGLPIGLFWFAWTARSSISWASPVTAIIPFAWGNLCVFVSTMQYTADAYHGNVVASASAANSLARYGFAAVFPLFTIQMYEKLGIDWASSLLGFISLTLLPIPLVLFNFGAKIRAKSKYETF